MEKFNHRGHGEHREIMSNARIKIFVGYGREPWLKIIEGHVGKILRDPLCSLW
jgi:hypothetical protein